MTQDPDNNTPFRMSPELRAQMDHDILTGTKNNVFILNHPVTLAHMQPTMTWHLDMPLDPIETVFDAIFHIRVASIPLKQAWVWTWGLKVNLNVEELCSMFAERPLPIFQCCPSGLAIRPIHNSPILSLRPARLKPSGLGWSIPAAVVWPQWSLAAQWTCPFVIGSARQVAIQALVDTLEREATPHVCVLIDEPEK